MKKSICTAIILIFVYSCRKDAVVKVDPDSYLHSVLSRLRDSLGAAVFAQLDTTKAYLTDTAFSADRGKGIFSGPDKVATYTLRLPFIGKPVAEDFVLLRTDPAGNILKGQVVHLGLDASRFSGSLQLQSLSGKVILSSTIENGFVTALHGVGRRPVQVDGGSGRQSAQSGGGLGQRPVQSNGSKIVTLEPGPNVDWLPEVIVVGYSGGGGASTSYISLDGLLGMSSGDILGGSSSGGDSGGGGAAPGGGGGGAAAPGGDAAAPGTSVDWPASAPVSQYSPVDPVPMSRAGIGHRPGGLLVSGVIGVEREYVYNLPAIDIRKFFNCFDLVPSEGAVYTVQLCVDLPVNSVPNASMNLLGRVSAGHTFLLVTKAGGGMSITQSFGYYPQSVPSSWNPFSPISPEIKNNGNQEINGSLTMTINSDQFNAIKGAAISFSTRPYQIDKSNCTDYALNVFNAGRNIPLTMEPYVLRQGGLTIGNGISSEPITVVINSSPQMLFDKLSTMKENQDPEAKNIQIDKSHNSISPSSHGECN